MVVTPLGIVTLVSPVQLLNASIPMVVTPSPISSVPEAPLRMAEGTSPITIVPAVDKSSSSTSVGHPPPVGVNSIANVPGIA